MHHGLFIWVSCFSIRMDQCNYSQTISCSKKMKDIHTSESSIEVRKSELRFSEQDLFRAK